MASKRSDPQQRVLILCTGNAARSQMAEGLLREISGGEVEVASAGVSPWTVHPMAIQVMAERGIDISGHRSKSVQEFADADMDEVITVCDHAAQNCPSWIGDSRRTHWSVADPVMVEGGEAERIEAFRRTRDLLEERLAGWWEERRGEASQ